MSHASTVHVVSLHTRHVSAARHCAQTPLELRALPLVAAHRVSTCSHDLWVRPCSVLWGFLSAEDHTKRRLAALLTTLRSDDAPRVLALWDGVPKAGAASSEAVSLIMVCKVSSTSYLVRLPIS